MQHLFSVFFRKNEVRYRVCRFYAVQQEYVFCVCFVCICVFGVEAKGIK